MNKSDECDIVKDLAAPYIENLINIKSKAFVEEHLKSCSQCQKYYNDMNADILNETQNERRKDNFELDFLKKVRKNMSVLKIILIIITIIISVIILSIIIKYQEVTKIIDSSYNSLESLKTLDNYKLIRKTVEINYEKNTTFENISSYYYKDGKYKIDNGSSICYCEDDSYNEIWVYNELKQIAYYTQNFIGHKKGEVFDIFSEIISYKHELIGLYKIILSIRTDMFNGIDCYVIRVGNNNSYKDVWINKDSYVVLRTIELERSKYYREEIYTLDKNVVTNEDVDSSILETKSYSDYTKNYVKYSAPKEIRNIYN